MAKKIKNDYFKLIEQQVAYCVEASNFLERMLCDFSAEDIANEREKMHIIEHKADEVHHDILNKLSTEFITPIDQEDILHLAQIIDSITDALDEVVMDFYMYNVNAVPAAAPELSRVVSKCVVTLYEVAKELKNFKKPEKLRPLIIQVNDIESEADRVHIDAVHKLFSQNVDTRELLSTMAIYDGLENCCDLCEHATDIIEQVVIKNT